MTGLTIPDGVADAVAEALGEALDCTRVWEAWSYGTMGPDDFSTVAEDGGRVAEIALAAITAWEASKPQPPPAIDLEQFRDCVHDQYTLHGCAHERDRLLALIDGQKAAPRGPDQPDLCDLCRVRDEVRTDAEGIPFCQECWDGWQAEEAKAVQP